MLDKTGYKLLTNKGLAPGLREQGIFRDSTGNSVCSEMARQTADRKRSRASARATSASVAAREALI